MLLTNKNLHCISKKFPEFWNDTKSIPHVIQTIKKEQEYVLVNQQKYTFDIFTSFVRKYMDKLTHMDDVLNQWIRDYFQEKGFTHVHTNMINDLRLAFHDSTVEEYFATSEHDRAIYDAIRENNYKMINEYFVFASSLQRIFNDTLIRELDSQHMKHARENWTKYETDYQTGTKIIALLNKTSPVTVGGGLHLRTTLRKTNQAKPLCWQNVGGYDGMKWRISVGPQETKETQHLRNIREKRNALENDVSQAHQTLDYHKNNLELDIKYGRVPEYISDPNQSRWTFGMKQVANPEIERRKQHISQLENDYNTIKSKFEIANKEFWDLDKNMKNKN